MGGGQRQFILMGNTWLMIYSKNNVTIRGRFDDFDLIAHTVNIIHCLSIKVELYRRKEQNILTLRPYTICCEEL